MTDLTENFTCDQCHTTFLVSLQCCSTCKVARYCGPECQRLDWPEHRYRCAGSAHRENESLFPEMKAAVAFFKPYIAKKQRELYAQGKRGLAVVTVNATKSYDAQSPFVQLLPKENAPKFAVGMPPALRRKIKEHNYNDATRGLFVVCVTTSDGALKDMPKEALKVWAVGEFGPKD